MTQLYQVIASAFVAAVNCNRARNSEWLANHGDAIDYLVANFMPSGSGFDNGTQFALSASSSKKLVFTTSFHKMDEWGGYDGWEDYFVYVEPAFDGIDVRVRGRNCDGLKEHVQQAFYDALTHELTPFEHAAAYGSNVVNGVRILTEVEAEQAQLRG